MKKLAVPEFDARGTVNGHTQQNTRQIRLVATDLDGTLLRSDQSISPRTRQTLARVVSSGIPVALVTGRPPRFVVDLASDLGLTGSAICANGAICYDMASQQLLEHHPMTSDTAAEIAGALAEALPGAVFAVERGLEYGCEPGYLALGVIAQDQGHIVADALTLCAQPITKLLARHPSYTSSQLHALAEPVVGPRAQVTFSGPHMIEISALGIDKAAALARLSARLGVDQDNVIAFGDMPNDAAMLRWAGLGVAVANAHTEALAAADEVTGSNMDDGVAMVLERYFPL